MPYLDVIYHPSPMKVCALCKQNPATKKNSHIFPRFLGVSLLTTPDEKRKGFTINEQTFKSGQKGRKPTQDTPKEDHILCPDCETKLGTIERYFANAFYSKFENKEQWNSLIQTQSPEGYQVKYLDGIDYEQIKLMIYSMAFRAAISSLEFFIDLRMREASIERLRRILNCEAEFEDIPLTIITPESDFNKTRNYIYANSNGFGECMMWANELLIFLNLENSDTELNRYFQDATSKNEQLVIGVVPERSWDSLRKMILDIKMRQMYGGR